MNHHSRRFVDNHQLVVLVYDVEWYVFRLNDVVVSRSVHHQRHHVERPHLVVALHRSFVHVYESSFGGFLYAVSAAVLQVFEEEFIHSHGHLSLIGGNPKVLVELCVVVAVVGLHSVQVLCCCEQFVIHDPIPPVRVRSVS